jgi:hypothetical protein
MERRRIKRNCEVKLVGETEEKLVKKTGEFGKEITMIGEP